VVERRQQEGMLRALGYQQRMVGFSFLLESSFISMTGLLIGALTGVVLGVTILRAFFPQLDAGAGTVPWLTIGFMVLLAYLFSLLTTIIPAWQASRIYPAEALRYE
jgi:putative ABC transport system permease protein